MNITHPEVEEFIDMRKSTGGDPHRRNTNLHHGVVLTENFLYAVSYNLGWDLIDPHTDLVVKTVKARDLWFKILETRAETGEPFLVNYNNMNDALPMQMQAKGLKVLHSNLCTEITLPVSENRTAVCCLSSVNIEKFNEWSTDQKFIGDLITMLDNVLDNFISEASSSPGMRKAVYSAVQERSIGLGAMGFHSYLQSIGVPIESAVAKGINIKVFSHIKNDAVETSLRLAKTRGEAPDMAGTGLRNAHLLAVAPNASSSVICGGTSPSIEPSRANVYTQKGVVGSSQVRNKYLEKLIHERLDGDYKAIEAVWALIYEDEGSVANISILTDYEKDIFKTFPEIDQMALVELAIDRQEYICQGQSLNLSFITPPSDAPQETHDRFMQYVSDVHFRAIRDLKTIYYYRGREATKVENVDMKIPQRKDSDCFFCEG
jgi:ribonucleoside-diphosphate reductase alpha chain